MHIAIVSIFNNYSHVSFNLLYLKAILEKYGHRCTLIFLLRTKRKRYINQPRILPTDIEVERIIEKLRCLKPHIVGISIYSSFFDAAIRITEEIKRRLKIPVVWGGIHPTIDPEGCIQCADLVCIGEGEEAVLELVERMERDSDISGIQNLWLRRNNNIVKNRIRPLIENLDTLPFPSFEARNWHYICTDGVYNPSDSKGVYNIIASRNCPFLCTYCSEHLIRRLYGKSFKYRTRSVENIILELNQAKKNKIPKVVSFGDAVFPHDRKWIEDFSYSYKKEINIPFAIRTHPLLIRRENIDLLAKAGLYHIGMSIESGSECVRREVFRRPVKNSMYIEIQKLLSQYDNLKISYGLIVDNPFEDMEEKEKSLEFLLALPGHFSLNPFTLTFFPKIDVTERALKERRIKESELIFSTRPSAPTIILNQPRSKDEKFWISLVFLFILYHRFRFLPRKIIYLIRRNTLLKKHPHLLFIVAYYLYSISIASFRFKAIARRLRNRIRLTPKKNLDRICLYERRY